MERIVIVAGRRDVIDVYRKSRALWIAVGEHRGRRIEIKGRSKAAVVAHWRATAQCDGG